MKDVKVLGSGCANCQNTAKLIETVARERQIDITLEKVTDMQKIMAYQILATPGVVIDGTVVHSGGVPSRAQIEQWLLAG